MFRRALRFPCAAASLMLKLGINAKSQLIFKKYTVFLAGACGVPGADSLHFPSDSYIGNQVGLVPAPEVGAEP